MKLTIFSILIALTAPAIADGFNPALADPEIIAPRGAWTGPYVGLSYGRTTRKTETVECFKLGQPRACDDPIFEVYPDYKVEVRSTTRTSDSAAGLRLGYRFDLGRVVPGIEAATATGLGAQLGLDLGNVLPYAHYDRDGAALGVELRLSPRLTAGLRAGEGGAALTLGWGW